jgi:hypothetical protein
MFFGGVVKGSWKWERGGDEKCASGKVTARQRRRGDNRERERERKINRYGGGGGGG